MSPELFFLSCIKYENILSEYKALRKAYLDNNRLEKSLQYFGEYIYIDLPMYSYVKTQIPLIILIFLLVNLSLFMMPRGVFIDDAAHLVNKMQEISTVVVADWMFPHLMTLCNQDRLLPGSCIIDSSCPNFLKASYYARMH